MKNTFYSALLAVSFCLGACTRDSASTYETSPSAATVETTQALASPVTFASFSEQLPALSLPFRATCSFTYVKAATIDTTTTHAYLKPNEIPYRLLPVNANVSAVLVLFPTDEMLPRLRTYAPSGTILDEQDLKFNPCRSEPGYDHREQFTIRKDLTIAHVDSTFRWQFDEQYNEVPNTRKLTVTRKTFRINARGAISETK